MHGAPPLPRGVPALLGAVFPVLGATDAGKAIAIHVADVGAALLSLAERDRG